MFLKKLRRKKKKKCIYFILTHIFTISYALLSIPWSEVTIWCHFLSAWRTYFRISYKANLLAMNSGFSFLFLNDIFNDCRILSGLFFLSVFWICLLISIVSSEIRAINSIIGSCNVISLGLFPYWFQSLLSYFSLCFGFQQFDYDMPSWVFLCIYRIKVLKFLNV